MKIEKVLAIETSCDDTSVAVVGADAQVYSVCSADQDLQHKAFGGVVPEIAGRSHTLSLLPLIENCLHKSGHGWDDIDAIAVTSRPGLIGSLMVGVVTAKSLALAFDKVFLGVNHLEGHLLAPFLRDASYSPNPEFDFPFLALAVSGGHTQLYKVDDFGQYKVLGQTIDDAAGEAFDKFAKNIGLGFPGGVKVDELAKTGNTQAYDFPRPLIKDDNFNFSFSGLKSSAQRKTSKMSQQQIKEQIHDLCASYQEAIVDVLLAKLDKAVKQYKIGNVAITGGVSANSRLRHRAQDWAAKEGLNLLVPPIHFCTDNAAMIGLAGIKRMNKGEFSDQSLAPLPKSLDQDFN